MFEFKYPTENYREPAGFGSRLLAFVLDIIAFIIIMLPFSILRWVFHIELSDFIKYLIFIIYFVILTWKYGRTFGKFNTELKVEKNNGEKISLLQSFTRMIFNWAFLLLPTITLIISMKSIDINNLLLKDSESIKLLMSMSLTLGLSIGLLILFIIDFGFMIFRKDKRALHDLIAGTRCMKK